MVVGIIRIKIRIAWSHSLKEKRKVVKSICAKVQNKFKVSIAEVGEQDTHQIIVLGIAYVTNGNSHADSIASHIVNFIEGSVEGELIEIEREIV